MAVRKLTFLALILGFHVAFELHVARSNVVEGRFDHLDDAGRSSWAALVKEAEDAREASHVAEVGPNAASETHASIDGADHHDDLIVVTPGLELLVVAVLLRTTIGGHWRLKARCKQRTVEIADKNPP